MESACRSLQRAIGLVQAVWIGDKAVPVLGSGGLAAARCQIWYQISVILPAVLSLCLSLLLTIVSDRCPQMWVAVQLPRIPCTSEGAGTGVK